ncbi:nucleotide pyrophosphohydrolase [Gemella cuniculi]|uniref:nucleotide pyrophosphohydrolase n=1 Tax=Gemella cuniculi TaxID=150240 RepID=UPI0024815B7A|nr:nucleotide pyrophosphohydrolase [Gemella cuniculi]
MRRLSMEELKEIITTFRAKRNWESYDTESSLAKSIVIEAAELLEHFQWEENEFNKKAVCDELADVLIYSLSMCYHMNVDPKAIIEEKLIDVARRYPEKK